MADKIHEHDCFLGPEEKQLLLDILKVANQVKGNVLKGFSFGVMLVFVLGVIGIVLSIKEMRQSFLQ